jgi:hypothetical protein
MEGFVDLIRLLRRAHPHVKIEAMDRIGISFMQVRAQGEMGRRKLPNVGLHRPQMIMVSRVYVPTIVTGQRMVQ